MRSPRRRMKTGLLSKPIVANDDLNEQKERGTVKVSLPSVSIQSKDISKVGDRKKSKSY